MACGVLTHRENENGQQTILTETLLEKPDRQSVKKGDAENMRGLRQYSNCGKSQDTATEQQTA